MKMRLLQLFTGNLWEGREAKLPETGSQARSLETSETQQTQLTQ